MRLVFILLLKVCSSEADNQLRMAAYEVLNAFVTHAANDSLPIVAKLSEVILERLEKTLPMQQQIVSVEDRILLEEIQTSLTSVLLVRDLPPAHVFQGLIVDAVRPLCNDWKGRSSLQLTAS